MADVTVITPTRGRPQLLQRALASARNQRGVDVEHIVVVDECPASAELVESSGSGRVLYRERAERIGSAEQEPRPRRYERLSRMYNLALAEVTTPYVAFLDDDNEFLPDHLSTLKATIENHRTHAAYSWRLLVSTDGTPYTDRRFPWAPNPRAAKRIAAALAEKGVWEPGSNVLRDRAEEYTTGRFVNSTRFQRGDSFYMVDQNVWLVDTAVARRTPYPERFNAADWLDDTCPDDKWLEALLRSGTRMASSQRATVRYYLGGMSNQNAADH